MSLNPTLPFITSDDLEFITYLALRTKSVPDICPFWEGGSTDDDSPSTGVNIEFVEPNHERARITLWINPKDPDSKRFILMVTDDSPGIDPFWNMKGMRLTETIAVFEKYNFKDFDWMSWEDHDQMEKDRLESIKAVEEKREKKAKNEVTH